MVWLIAILAAAFTMLYAWWNNMTTAPDPSAEQKQAVTIPAGMTVREAGDLLEEKGLIKSSAVFYYTIRFNLYLEKGGFKLKSGTYALSPSMSMREVYDILQEGIPYFVTVSIPEGLTISKTGYILEENKICRSSDFAASCRSQKILEKYQIPGASAEGFLFPDTYFLVPGTPSDDVVTLMIDTFLEKIQTVSGFEDKKLPDYYQCVILASIIEREYRLKEEAPVISSVFNNRLRNNIGLYSCATVEYIITEIEGRPHPERITAADLKLESPYNTYKWAGLPPSPISNPGLIALDAAMNPADTDYFFFVLNNSEKGSHTFSRSFDQHKAAQNINSYSSKGRRR